MTHDAPALSITDLHIGFRSRRGLSTAVRGVSFDIARGETLALVGESGSGKSTTAAAVNRLLPDTAEISEGSIVVAGRDVAALAPRELQALRGAGIGLVPQDPMTNLNPVMRIGDQIAEAFEVHDVATGSQAHDRAVQLLEAVGIPDAATRARQYPHEFSGGMRQRVLIAMGLACKPALLIADEPTSALDVTVQRRVLDLLADLTDEMGTAVLLITHDLTLAAERADRVAVMQAGEIVEIGTAHDVMHAPQHDYTRRLLAAIPGTTATPRDQPASSGTESSGTGSSGAAATPLVEVRDLVKVYGGGTKAYAAVDGVSLTIPAGRTVSVVGESGSGKSTVANMLLGLVEPTSGTVLVDGQPVAGGRRALKAVRRRIQPVFQNPYASLDPRFTVGRSVAEPMGVHGIGDKASRRARVAELLEQVALPADVADRHPHQLSGGQRQRVAIARALSLEPDLVVLDEAVSALDVLVQQQILELLARLQSELGLAYLFISHDLAVVRMISDEVHVMQQGRIVESGSPEALFSSPQEDYTQELLSAIPRGA
ncbi:ABC transporter ATP-binding protein [Knoellia locipacati]|uniref:Peptide ABC transporter ATP-binding protein n=1 Tax=Knoellia locipacati TaxID=882824 RepID=A0A512T014_9MICO|nr:ABC transporter ATP-binding protein [Knoellia locipacati]GEQ13566.1 peptide ABC transporter ATP-binding protein [Knoellia locipacati]